MSNTRKLFNVETEVKKKMLPYSCVILFCSVLRGIFLTIENELSCQMGKNDARLLTEYIQNIFIDSWGRRIQDS